MFKIDYGAVSNGMVQCLTNNSLAVQCVVGAGVLAATTNWGLNAAYRRKLRKKVEEKRRIVDEKRKVLRNRLSDNNGDLVNDAREEIVSSDIVQLLEQLKGGHLDPVVVLEAFQAKALSVDDEINAICDWITEATVWAENLRAIPQDKRGSLYGLPISVKECFFVKGYDCTIGMAKYIDEPAKDDCDLIRFIKEEHGIPFCLTNIPQTMISFGCSNPVFGKTFNPHDHSRSPGGSSGGESALIAAGGSILGLGGDIGGSLRIPSHFCGTVALKPTNGRIYESGKRGSVGAGAKVLRHGIYAVAGFMASSVSAVVIGTKLLIDNARRMSREDWRVIPLPWQGDLYVPNRKLRIGWYDYDGNFPATPSCTRAVREVAERMRENGHHVEEWRPESLVGLMECVNDFLLADKGYHSLKAWKGEQIDQAIEVNEANYKTPLFLKSLLSPLVGLASRQLQRLWDAGPILSRDLWVRNAEKDRLIYEMMREWEKKGFDILLCPGFSFPACPHHLCSRLLPGASYTSVYNVAGNPVGILPVTKENARDQENLDNYPVKQDLCFRLAASATRGAEGCPIGVQVVGRHYQEEMVLHAMEIIEDIMEYDSEI